MEMGTRKHTLIFIFIITITSFKMLCCVSTSSHPHAGSKQMPSARCQASQRSLLLNMSSTLDLSLSWNSSGDDCCKWSGITCE
eukprot:c43035_g1_i1 orf=81-329(+)